MPNSAAPRRPSAGAAPPAGPGAGALPLPDTGARGSTLADAGRRPSPDSAPAALLVQGLDMRFGATHALRSVDLEVRAGEIHGLLGQNGSGKSTLIKVLAGLHTPSAGRLWLSGAEVALPLSASSRAALRLAFVHQDLGLLPELSVVENMWSTKWAAGRARTRISWRAARRSVEETLAAYDVRLDPGMLIRDLSPVERATLAVVRAMDLMRPESGSDRGPGLLVLDEPSVFLSGSDAERLYRLMRLVAADGSGVLFVSHDIDEVKQVTDRLTVLRDGRQVGTEPTAGLSVGQIVKMVVGSAHVAPGSATACDARQRARTRTEGLAVRKLSSTRLHDVGFDAAPGGIVGLTGLPGSGYEDVLYALYGALPASAGTVAASGAVHGLPQMTPTRARALGFAFVPSDRLTQGCVPHMTVAENNTLPSLRTCRRGIFHSRRLALAAASRQIAEYGIKVEGPAAAYATMSGGNQQKAVLAKWLDSAPRVLLLNQPSQGVDVGARSEIWQTLRRGAADRITLCATADHDELIGLCDTVLVFRQGRVSAELEGTRMTKAAIAQHSVLGGQA